MESNTDAWHHLSLSLPLSLSLCITFTVPLFLCIRMMVSFVYACSLFKLKTMLNQFSNPVFVFIFVVAAAHINPPISCWHQLFSQNHSATVCWYCFFCLYVLLSSSLSSFCSSYKCSLVYLTAMLFSVILTHSVDVLNAKRVDFFVVLHAKSVGMCTKLHPLCINRIVEIITIFSSRLRIFIELLRR